MMMMNNSNDIDLPIIGMNVQYCVNNISCDIHVIQVHTRV